MPTVPGQRFAGKRDNKPSDDPVLVPATIAEQPDKLEMWRWLVADLTNRQLFKSTYSVVIEELVETYCLVKALREALTTQGLMVDVKNRKGDVIGTEVNPVTKEIQRHQVTLLKLLEKLGMSPKDIVFLQGPDGPAPQDVIPDAADSKGIVYFR